MKGGDVGRGVQPDILQQRGDTLAHLVRGLIREGNRQYGGRRHPPRGDNVRDTMRDDSRLTTARAGEYEERSLRMTDRFPLLRIQALEEIHEIGDYMRV